MLYNMINYDIIYYELNTFNYELASEEVYYSPPMSCKYGKYNGRYIELMRLTTKNHIQIYNFYIK